MLNYAGINYMINRAVNTKNRVLPHWQTLKLMLSSLIVFNFYLGSNLLNKTQFFWLEKVFNLSLIPMFVFIAAYTTKNMTWKEWRLHLSPAIIIYFIFQTVDCILLYFEGEFCLTRYFLFPQNGVWFFLAVPIWQAFFLLLPSYLFRHFISRLLFLIAIFILSYFVTQNFAHLTGFVALLHYFPFFILAYFFQDKQLLWLRQQGSKVIVALGAVALILVYYFSLFDSVQIKILGYSSDFYLLSYSILLFLISLIFGGIIIYFSLSTSYFNAIAQYALAIYLLHPFVCFVLLSTTNLLKIKIAFLEIILLTLLTIIISLCLVKIPFIQWAINPNLKQQIPK